MKIRIISDLHLQFGEFILPIMEDEKNMVLCIAGDVNPSKLLHNVDIYNYEEQSTFDFFSSISNRFKKVLYIAGNHEYYYGDIFNDNTLFKMFCKQFKNFRFLENEKATVGDTVFIGATLWTDFQGENETVMNTARTMMNDFHCIRCNTTLVNNCSYKFTPEKALSIFHKSKKYIFKQISSIRSKDLNKKIVVMTHHAPHPNSIHDTYKGDALNGAYYTDLTKEIMETQPNLMIHGHVHNSFDYEVGNTRVICNPRGYNKRQENPDFNPNLVIEI